MRAAGRRIEAGVERPDRLQDGRNLGRANKPLWWRKPAGHDGPGFGTGTSFPTGVERPRTEVNFNPVSVDGMMFRPRTNASKRVIAIDGGFDDRFPL